MALSHAQKTSLLKKLSVSVPGKSNPDLEEHLAWYLKYLFLTLYKKKVVSEWKRETEQARSKQSQEAFQEELGGGPERDSQDSEDTDKGPAMGNMSPDEERQAAREKLARWKAEKVAQQEAEKVPNLCP